MTLNKQKPVYLRLTGCLADGFVMLDSRAQAEIVDFIHSQRYKDGGFTDRSGNPDIYYSLFGYWLQGSAGLYGTAEDTNRFLQYCRENYQARLIDRLALRLIELYTGTGAKTDSLPNLLKKLISDNSGISSYYRLFLLVLILDAENRLYLPVRWFARLLLEMTPVNEHLPASIIAAYTYARFRLGMNHETGTKLLQSRFDERMGFRAFASSRMADMLSTAVSLFVLRETGNDLSLVAPSCLDFIEMNYDSGAFLSGDGDKIRDLEYTFYGLLALGSLSSADYAEPGTK